MQDADLGINYFDTTHKTGLMANQGSRFIFCSRTG